MKLRPDKPSVLDVIRLPKVAPKSAAQAQWSDTLPLDFAETVPTAILLTEEEAPEVLGPHDEG